MSLALKLARAIHNQDNKNAMVIMWMWKRNEISFFSPFPHEKVSIQIFPYGGHRIMKQGVFKVYPVSSPRRLMKILSVPNNSTQQSQQSQVNKVWNVHKSCDSESHE